MTIPGLSESAAAVRHYQAKVTDMQYPKSLGELCLEYAEDLIRHYHRPALRMGNIRPYGDRDTNILRRAMWHKERP